MDINRISSSKVVVLIGLLIIVVIDSSSSGSGVVVCYGTALNDAESLVVTRVQVLGSYLQHLGGEEVLVRWAKGKWLINRPPNLSLITLSPWNGPDFTGRCATTRGSNF